MAQTVQQSNYKFSPDKVSVKSGSAIGVQNLEGRTPHTFTVAGTSINVVNDPGKTQTATVDLQPGTYQFFCSFHKKLGMKGTLTVT